MKSWLTKNTNNFSKPIPLRLIHFIIFLFFIFSGCNEEGGYLGRELLPNDDNIKLGYQDNFNIAATTQHSTPQFTEGVDTLLVGIMDDPVFGRTEASFIAQLIFEIVRPSVYVGRNPEIHSPVLNLGYINTYGQEDVYPQLNVYELLEIPDSADSYSNTDIKGKYKGNLLNAEPSRRQGNFIRIPLQESYIQDVLEFMDTDTTLTFFDPTDPTEALLEKFADLFPGLYIEASPDEGSNTVLRISPSRIASYISFTVESNTDTTLEKTITFPFKHDTIETFRANYIDHDYTNSVAIDSIGKSDTRQFYLQGFDGLNGKLTIAGLDTFKNSVGSDIAVNNATLFIPFDVTDNTASSFPRPNRLMLTFADGQFLPGSFDLSNRFPLSLKKVNRFDGRLNLSEGGYQFNISGYVQEYVNGNVSSNELILSVPDLPIIRTGNRFDPVFIQYIRPSITHTDRVILENNTSAQITLEVYYNELGE